MTNALATVYDMLEELDAMDILRQRVPPHKQYLLDRLAWALRVIDDEEDEEEWAEIAAALAEDDDDDEDKLEPMPAPSQAVLAGWKR